MNFKEYFTTNQSELVNEDFGTSMRNLISGIFGKRIAIDTN